jgi:hypothetical protein
MPTVIENLDGNLPQLENFDIITRNDQALADAINEGEGNFNAHVAGTLFNHYANAIFFSPILGITATELQGAIEQLNTRVDNIVNNPDPNKDAELVDGRNSAEFGVFSTLKERLDFSDKNLIMPKMLGGGLLINGNFDVPQRGTTVIINAPSGYGLDRWKLIRNNIGAATMKQLANDSPSNAIFKTRIEISADSYGLMQRAEKIGGYLKNKKTTVSFYGKADIAYSTQLFLSGSVNGNIESKTVNFTTAWQKFTFTFNGYVLVDTEDVGIYLQTLIENTELASVKFEIGDIATDFIPKTFADELRDCQRYYYRPFAPVSASYFGFGTADSTVTAQIGIEFPSQMRITPTLIVTASELRLSDAVTSVVCSDATLNTPASTRDRVILNCTASSGLTQFRPYRLLGQIIEPNFAFDAEL